MGQTEFPCVSNGDVEGSNLLSHLKLKNNSLFPNSLSCRFVVVYHGIRAGGLKLEPCLHFTSHLKS